MSENTIPKIIHYCWFGHNELPETLNECMKSWEILTRKGYKIIRWDESNCTFEENDFVKQAYKEKRWGFIGDYYRAKALFDIGGIYLDTDVIIKKTFDDLLENEAFMGFSSKYALCTAVVGAKKGSSFIKGIMNMYDNNAYISKEVVMGLDEPRNNYKNGVWTPSNEFWGWYMIYNHPDFKLNNKYQRFNDIVIFPKQYFELGNFIGTYYSRHINYNSWREKQGTKNILKKIKKRLEENEKCWIIIRRLASLHGQKKNNFYEYYRTLTTNHQL